MMRRPLWRVPSSQAYDSFFGGDSDRNISPGAEKLARQLQYSDGIRNMFEDLKKRDEVKVSSGGVECQIVQQLSEYLMSFLSCLFRSRRIQIQPVRLAAGRLG